MDVRSTGRLAVIALTIAVIASGISVLALLHPARTPTPAAAQASPMLERLDRANVIRAGYGVFPPFTQEDPRTGKVSGVSVDIVEEIARELGATVEWRRLNWNTMGADLKRGEFDVVADPIFQTPQRAREFTFTQPYAYFAIGIGVVRKGERRFKVFEDINHPAITVAVGQGFGEETLVKSRAPQARLLSIPAAQDSATPINSVLTGRADIAITNLDDARRFVAAHPDTLEMLWVDNPPAYVPAGFALQVGDTRGAQLLDVSLRNLRGAGILTAIAARHGATVNLNEPGP